MKNILYHEERVAEIMLEFILNYIFAKAKILQNLFFGLKQTKHIFNQISKRNLQ